MPMTGIRSPDFGIGLVISGSCACSTISSIDKRGKRPNASPAPANRPSLRASRREGLDGNVIWITIGLRPGDSGAVLGVADLYAEMEFNAAEDSGVPGSSHMFVPALRDRASGIQVLSGASRECR